MKVTRRQWRQATPAIEDAVRALAELLGEGVLKLDDREGGRGAHSS